MNRIPILAITVPLILAQWWLAYTIGYKACQSRIPSCIYLERPRGNDVKPLGYDNREGVDWYCSAIFGGGLYVSLEQWKK